MPWCCSLFGCLVPNLSSHMAFVVPWDHPELLTGILNKVLTFHPLPQPGLQGKPNYQATCGPRKGASCKSRGAAGWEMAPARLPRLPGWRRGCCGSLRGQGWSRDTGTWRGWVPLAAPSSQSSLRGLLCIAARSQELQRDEAPGVRFCGSQMRAASALPLLPRALPVPPPWLSIPSL